MSKFVLLDADINVDGTDLSNFASSVEIEDSAEEKDLTGFGDDYRVFAQGLKDATITVTFFNDFDAASVDAILEPLYSGGSTFDVVVKPTSAAVSSTNPSYTMTSRMFSYSPFGGAIGEASDTDVAFRNAGGSGVVKATA